MFIRQRTLFAQPFNAGAAAISGDPVRIADGVASFSVARSGVIAYRIAESGRTRQFHWMTRSGKDEGPAGPEESVSNPDLSADGKLVFDTRRDLWMFDGARTTRLTFSGAIDFVPRWEPDNRHIVFSSNRRGVLDLFRTEIGQSSGGEPILETATDKLVTDVSPDGRVVAFHQFSATATNDIWTVPLGGGGMPTPFLATSFNELAAQFSPDGRWMAYQSDESGRMEIYARPFPANRGGAQQLVSTAGGIWPRWSRDGREIYYAAPTGMLMAVPVTVSDQRVDVRPSVALFPLSRRLDARVHAQYDVDRAGRFVVRTDADAAPTPVTVVLNWNPPPR